MVAGRAIRKRDINAFAERMGGMMAGCRETGAVYAACVATRMDSIEQNVCKAEFEAFKKCFTAHLASRR